MENTKVAVVAILGKEPLIEALGRMVETARPGEWSRYDAERLRRYADEIEKLLDKHFPHPAAVIGERPASTSMDTPSTSASLHAEPSE